MAIQSPAKLLVCPAMLLPALWLVPIVIGLVLPDFNSLAQHLSEIAVMESVPAALATLSKISLGLIDIAILLFPIGLLWYFKQRLSFTVVLGLVYGLGMLSNSIFPTGSPLHGLYGLPIYSVIIPAIFALEYGQAFSSPAFIRFSIVTTILNLMYLWANAVGLDPQGYRGLTQILAIYVINLWYCAAACMVYRHTERST